MRATYCSPSHDLQVEARELAAAAAAEEAARAEADAMESDLQAEAEKLRQAAGDSEARQQQAEKAECVLICCCWLKIRGA